MERNEVEGETPPTQCCMFSQNMTGTTWDPPFNDTPGSEEPTCTATTQIYEVVPSPNLAETWRSRAQKRSTHHRVSDSDVTGAGCDGYAMPVTSPDAAATAANVSTRLISNINV